ncbi:uncharacterized protein ACLA_007380 [Aspergillus clavatus NRRL 1]|uniref:Uncharacterized protein n=1 Tax=Aspergillus clavatus (strain ATCC 1007 / CBS 513.65 / DSM 816 / NCTC 3887 / NRRL 1 / QM 1276 / 107) TaxID=344612 RepID=A1CDQ2_ASPCL|nr:uncharacterized protein ACLA_007380 [Aspergillus clavatus NRRL 1]EAW11979.1 hypothetical protein ACLA_007380 [Aspergillus clavatus NRRL 1]
MRDDLLGASSPDANLQVFMNPRTSRSLTSAIPAWSSFAQSGHLQQARPDIETRG